MDHGLRQHAKYSASSAARWMACPGSVKLAETAPPQPESTYALDGTEAHELLDYALKNGHTSADTAYFELMPNWTFRHDDLQARIDSVQTVIDYVDELRMAYDDMLLYVEHKFRFPSTVTQEAYGFNDVCLYSPALSLLYVIDFKHGAGTAVEVVTWKLGTPILNKQLAFYGTGAVCGSNPIDADTIVLAVVQPRAFHKDGPIREHTVTKATLENFIFDVDMAILECEEDKPLLSPGEEQCKFCPAKLVCPALEARALSVVSDTFSSVKHVSRDTIPDVRTMPLDRLAYIMQAAPILRAWLTSVEEAAFQYELAEPGSVPGYKLVEAKPRRQWYNPNGNDLETATSLMRMMDLDLNDVASWDKVFPRKLLTITEADRVVKAHFKEKAPRGQKKQAAEDATEALAALTLKTSSGNLTLVEASDPRPPANRAGLNFANVKFIEHEGSTS